MRACAMMRMLQQLVAARAEARYNIYAVSAQAVLERLLQQLVATRAEALAANGGSGQPFLLRQHLLPPPPAKASALSAMADMVE